MNFGFIFAALASIAWGLAYTLDQKILEKLPPIVLISLSYLVCFILTIPFLFYENKNFSDFSYFSSIDKKMIITFLISVLLTFSANYFILAGIKELNASTASIVEITYPVFVIIFSFIIFRTVPNYLFLIGTVIVLFGISMIIKSTNMVL